jgi:hypothetical protein
MEDNWNSTLICLLCGLNGTMWSNDLSVKEFNAKITTEEEKIEHERHSWQSIPTPGK